MLNQTEISGRNWSSIAAKLCFGEPSSAKVLFCDKLWNYLITCKTPSELKDPTPDLFVYEQSKMVKFKLFAVVQMRS